MCGEEREAEVGKIKEEEYCGKSLAVHCGGETDYCDNHQ